MTDLIVAGGLILASILVPLITTTLRRHQP
jgi:hypothetical protein